MALEGPEEHREVLSHLMERVREDDPVLYGQIAEQFEATGEARSDLLRYLDLVIDAYASTSHETYRMVLANLNEYVSGSEGGEIEGIEIGFTAEDSALYEAERIDFEDLPDREGLLTSLREIRNLIVEG